MSPKTDLQDSFVFPLLVSLLKMCSIIFGICFYRRSMLFVSFFLSAVSIFIRKFASASQNAKFCILCLECIISMQAKDSSFSQAITKWKNKAGIFYRPENRRQKMNGRCVVACVLLRVLVNENEKKSIRHLFSVLQQLLYSSAISQLPNLTQQAEI